MEPGLSPYRNENDSLFDSFLVEIRYKLLPQMELAPPFFAGALPLAIVTLVILCEPDLKFSL